MRLGGRQVNVKNIQGSFVPGESYADIFAKKIHLEMNILDTDYDNYLIAHQCFDHIRLGEDNNLKPVHLHMVSIATRKADLSDSEFAALQKRVIDKIEDLSASDFTRHPSGKEAKC